MSEINVIDLNNLAEEQNVKPKRGRPKKSTSTKKENKPTLDLFREEADEEQEKKELKEKLLQYADYNEDIVNRPINDRIHKLINEMDIDELRARCRQGKKICSSRMNSVVGAQILNLANKGVGGLLECYDELQASTDSDELLKETVTNYFSLHILDFIPDEVKIAGIYGSHVINAYYEASTKNDSELLIEKLKMIKSSLQNQALQENSENSASNST